MNGIEIRYYTMECALVKINAIVKLDQCTEYLNVTLFYSKYENCGLKNDIKNFVNRFTFFYRLHDY